MPILGVGFGVRFFVMVSTLSRAALGLLALFVGTGVVIGLGLLWLVANWEDDETPLD
jgi:hypothetical protein